MGKVRIAIVGTIFGVFCILALSTSSFSIRLAMEISSPIVVGFRAFDGVNKPDIQKYNSELFEFVVDTERSFSNRNDMMFTLLDRADEDCSGIQIGSCQFFVSIRSLDYIFWYVSTDDPSRSILKLVKSSIFRSAIVEIDSQGLSITALIVTLPFNYSLSMFSLVLFCVSLVKTILIFLGGIIGIWFLIKRFKDAHA